MIVLPFSVVISVITIWEPKKFEKENLTSSNIGKLKLHCFSQRLGKTDHPQFNKLMCKLIYFKLKVKQNLFQVNKIQKITPAISTLILPDPFFSQ